MGKRGRKPIPVNGSHLHDIVKNVAEYYLLEPDLILGHTRRQPYPEARRDVAGQLYKLGYSYLQIGKAMNRHHTSIMYMTDEDYRQYNMEQNRKRHHK